MRALVRGLPLSLRHIEEIMQERGVFVDHARPRFIETMHMIRKGRLDCSGRQTMSAVDQLYTLAI